MARKRSESKRLPKQVVPPLGRLREMVLDYFRKNPGKPVNHKQVAAAIGVRGQDAYASVAELLDVMAGEKVLRAQGRYKYVYKQHGKQLEGLFRRKSRGHNLLIPDDGGDPIRIAERNSKHAMDGDRVRIALQAKRRGEAPEGEVVEILERKEQTFVGILTVSSGIAFVVSESGRLANDILIPERNIHGAQEGDKVVVRVVEWPERAKNPVGEVLSVLGEPGDNDTEMHAILSEYGLPYSYPEEVEQAAEQIDAACAFDQYEREDFRAVPTFTIDPESAKDFDDALSVRRLADGVIEVGVHIADVTAYVKPGDTIDREAARRATSVYLVDRTVPMLPERLCNDLCSLMPGVDRPAYSAIFRLDAEGEVLAYRIVRTVIHSDRRLTYEQAQELIESTKSGDYADEIRLLNTLAQKRRDRRMQSGSIDFERASMKFVLDDKGKPLGVRLEESKEANKLIEEFMLLANQTVAAHIGKVRGRGKAPVFVYRVHDQPAADKLRDLSEFVMRFGYKVLYTGSAKRITQSINKLLDDVAGKPEKDLIETLAIRSMAKAVYSTDNIGHYGLGFEYYTHFTSPIRRHPDMMVHRLLTHYAEGGESVSKTETEKVCVHDSYMESLAAQAERSSIKYKQVEYMQDKIGQVFDGVISGVVDFGLFVEIVENGCEGLVPIRELDDDYYELNEKEYCLVGFNTKKRYSLGDKIAVRVMSANLTRRQLDFDLP